MATKVVEIDWTRADEEKALIASRALCQAYDNGSDRGGSMEWDDVELAVEFALEAIPGAREAVEEAREILDDDEIEGIDVTWKGDLRSDEGSSSVDRPVPAVEACLRMIRSARYEDGSKWEEVDDAWEAAKTAVEQASAPKP